MRQAARSCRPSHSAVRVSRSSRILTALRGLLPLLIVLVAAGAVRGDPSAAQSQTATVRVVHALPDVAAVDVSLDGHARIEGLAYTAASTRQPTAGGAVRLQVMAAGDASRALLDVPIELPASGPSTVLLIGLAAGSPAPTALVLDDDLGPTPHDRIRLRFVHAAAGLAATTLLSGESTTLFAGVEYGGTGDGVLDPGRFALRVITAGPGPATVAEQDLIADPGRTYTLLLVGQSGGNRPALVVLDHSRAIQAGATAASQAAPGAVLVDETFGNPATGVLPATSPAGATLLYGYADGEYFLRNLEVATQSLAVPVDRTDATIAVDARLIGDTTQRTLSVGCRFASDPSGNRGYRLRIEPAAGVYRLVREDGPRDTFLRRDTRSPAIRGALERNRIEITCAGSTITATINGTVVASVQDSTYTSGSLVIGVGARASGLTSEARFDNLLITAR